VSAIELIGWDRLRHGGLLLDAPRLRRVAEYASEPLTPYEERELRRLAIAMPSGSATASDFVTFVLEKVCRFSVSSGSWQRGSQVGAEWGRRTVTGETAKPRQVWRGENGAILPVFFDAETRLGIGRGRKASNQAVQWLRSGTERLALLTNGRQWRLIFAGLDFDAWCEWDADLWFAEGGLSPQIQVLRTLLQPALWTPPGADTPAPLLQAIIDSRKGQAELSAVLGERVREAVELLVQAHGEILKELCDGVDPADIYRAAVRVVMRLVVVLFAESRELLPRDNALYHGAYGLSGLLEDLEKVGVRGGNRLARSWNAWPRVLALFRLVHQGSHHPGLPVPAYGGELFAPGDPASADGLSKALSVFEMAAFDHELLSDRDVHKLLERITRTKVKIRQGRASTWVPAPVDFSDLSSEYIGILYEGLLDFELKTAPKGDPVIFLAVGNQPGLPLSRLEAMDDKALASLLEKMKDTSKSEGDDEEAGEDSGPAEEESADEEASAEDNEDDGDHEDITGAGDDRHATRTRAEVWARRAVEAGKLARRPRGAITPEKRLVYEDNVARKARQLVIRVILPGEWYVVRWGGTRKGSGTFYTRPGLAVPTVQRTLRPLAYVPPIKNDGSPDLDATQAAWTPKTPEEILALKVCDPACGSGTFPVAALRFLTDALFASLHHHGRVSADGERAVVRLLQNVATNVGTAHERLGQELLPCRPDDALFEPRLKAILRRHVVERSIYGVDLDPLAVELCRLALWIETMDRTLPFSFLDHKVRCGNALVGAWFDQFQHYPAMAWKNREGGDKNHTNGVHFEKDSRTKAIKAFVKEKLTPDLVDAIVNQRRVLLGTDPVRPLEVHAHSLATVTRLHELPVQDAAERARIYQAELAGSSEFCALKSAMDTWCACWFWPADELDAAPLPTNLAAPTTKTTIVAARVAARNRFFHWELEFPDVFRVAGSGFDAILGNPPWDIAKPNSKEFFSNIDPLYRSYGKQEALRFQTEYFSNERVERDWLDHNANFRALSNAVSYSASPFGDPSDSESCGDSFAIVRGSSNAAAHTRWRAERSKIVGFADPTHPFRHQGSADLNLYKLFLEQAHVLLRPGGRMGFIVPSGLYSDHGTGGLRQLFLDGCRWEWIFGFENRDKIFEIHSSFKFNPVVIEKRGKTEAIRTAFMRRKLEDWEHAEAMATSYTRAQVERFSPRSKAILEIQSPRDLEILEKIYANSVLLGDESPDGWGIKYATGFHMTNDSKLFPPRPKWEADGYRPDEYGRWLKGNWRPVGELWSELGLRPLPSGERRCAQPPYDVLPIPRADIPLGILLSRDANAWIREDEIPDIHFTDSSGQPVVIKIGRGRKALEFEARGRAIGLSVREGRMIGQFDFSQKGWVSGKGRGAIWRDITWGDKRLEPQFLMGSRTKELAEFAKYLEWVKATRGEDLFEEELARLTAPDHDTPDQGSPLLRVSFMDVTSATNERTMIASAAGSEPHGNSAPLFVGTRRSELVLGVLNSFTYDFVARARCCGLHLNWFVVEESVLPSISDALHLRLAKIVQRLACCSTTFAWQWSPSSTPWRALWGLTDSERLRLRTQLEAIHAAVFGLGRDELLHILADCDHPLAAMRRDKFSVGLPPRGFWRVDKSTDPELRQTVLALVAFHDLEEKIRDCGGDKEKGIDAFLEQNDGQGWMLPETLRLADYGLGHDERAKHHQPVASRLGPRFYEWQLAQSVEESWRECELHARNLLGESGYQNLKAGIASRASDEKVEAVSEPKTGFGQNAHQSKLFN
jgi:hypothetical protein